MIDDNVENRFLLTRTLQRKYPRAQVAECGELAEALMIVGGGEIDAVVSHRAGEVDGVELVRELRRANATVPIVMVSGLDRTRGAWAAGATRFLNYDEWLRLGSVIDDIFATQPWAAVIGALAYAIRTRTIVTFAYQSEAGPAHHQVEPHLLGESAAGQFVLRACSTGQNQRGGFVWESYLIAQITGLAFTERTFAPHDGQTTDRHITRVLCQA